MAAGDRNATNAHPSRRVTVRCPECEQSYRVAERLLGRRLLCRHCRHEWRATAADGNGDAPAEANRPVGSIDPEAGSSGHRVLPDDMPTADGSSTIVDTSWSGRRLGRYRGEAVVAADGARSGLLRKAGMRFHERGYRMGLRLHFALPRPLEMEWVRVGLFSPWDVYVTPVSEGELLATTMCDRAAYRRIVTDYPGFLASTPFASLFAGARPASRPLAWHHPLFVPERFTAGGMLAVGDAGGGIDPCLGTGVSFALATAREAARAVTAILDCPAGRPEAENAFEAWRAGLFRHYALFDTVFRSLVTSPFGSEALVWGMRHWPGTAAAITRIVAENAPWHTFPWSSLLRPSWN
ncbi:MAG: hypothetical protein IIA41_02435 [SAR324 cluster bacterium]|nr:hypothetical protein [SAR324 cluster bacterium]